MNTCVTMLAVCVTAAALPLLAANLVVNPGFETGTFAGWSNQTEFSVVTNAPHAGAYCAQCVATATRALMQDIAITPPADGSTDFVISYWYLKTNGNVRIWSRWAPTNYTGTTITPGSYNPAAPEWRQLAYTNRPAAGATNFHFEVRVYSGATVVLDDFALERGGSGADPHIVVSPDTVSFGEVQPGSVHTQQFTIYNSGASTNLIVTAFTPDTGATDRFAILFSTPVTLSPGVTTNVPVVYTTGSTSGATHNATWQITSNDPSQPQTPVSFSGRTAAPVVIGNLWINEIHYDNASTDTNEGAEVAGAAGVDLTGYSIVAYNGNDGKRYKTAALAGVLADTQAGFGVKWFPIAALQNGPDGLALVRPDTSVVQFLSYAGSFIAVDGPAAGMVSEDIGVTEPSTLAVGYSLQLVGAGAFYSDFTWAITNATPDAVNLGQVFKLADDPNIVVTPSVLAFGVVAVGRAVTNTFQISNIGAHVTLTNTAFTPAAGATERFGITPPAPVLVPPGGAVTMTVAFAAGSIPNTNYTATFAIASNDPSDPATPINFSGRCAAPAPVWINEIEADDPGADDQEFIELAGYAGTNLLDWKLELYNGDAPTNPPYATHTIGQFTLSNKYTADGRAIGFFVLSPNGSSVVGDEVATFSTIQNGPDAICLRDPSGAVVHFFEYGSATPTTFAQAGTPADWTALVDTAVSNTTLAKWPQPDEWFNAPWANSTTPDEYATPGGPNIPEPAALLTALAAALVVNRRRVL